MPVSRFSFTERARPVVEVGFGASSTTTSAGARWDVDEWDESGFAEWAGVEPTWIDASEFCQQVDTQAGRERVTDTVRAGRAVFLFGNDSGWADPNATPGDGEPQLTLGQQIRVGVYHSAFGYCWKFRGFIDDIEPVWDADADAVVAVRAIDALSESGRATVAKLTPEADGETATDRIATILDEAPWTESKRIIDTVATELIEATLDGKAIDLLRRSAESVGGWVFGDTDGNVVFRGPSWLNGAAVLNPQVTVTNDPAISEPVTACASSWSRPARRRDITARVVVSTTADDAVPEVYESQTVIDDYGAESIDLRDLWTKDGAARESIAERLLETRTPDSVPRVERLALYGTTSDMAVDAMALLDFAVPTRLRARHLDSSGGVIFDDQCFVTGVAHHITPDEWSVDVALDLSSPFVIETGPALWDVDEWDNAQWS